MGARPGGAGRLRGQPDGRRLPARRPAARLRGRQGGRRCCATTRPGRRRRCPTGFADAQLHRRSRSPGAQAIVAAGDRPAGQRRRRLARRRGRAAAVRDAARAPSRASSRSPACPTAARSRRARLRDRARRSHRAVALLDPAAARRHARSRSPRSAPAANVRALAAVQPQLPYPVPDVLPETDPDSPPPLVPPFPLPGDGYLVRETDGGWRDEQRTALRRARPPTGPLKSDPIARAAGRRARRGLGARRLERRVRRRRPRQRQPLEPGPRGPRARADRRGLALRDRRPARAAARAGRAPAPT